MRRGWVAAVVIALAVLVGARRCRSAKPEPAPNAARERVDRALDRVPPPRLVDAPRAPRQRALEPATEVRGLVVRADTRAPVVGATVELRAIGSLDPIEVTTDETGRFTAAGLAPRRYEITAHAPGLAPVFTVEVQPEVGAPIDDVLCELAVEQTPDVDLPATGVATAFVSDAPARARGLLEGRIVDERGTPLAGAYISFRGPELHVGGAEADDAGFFRVTGLDAPGTYTFRLYAGLDTLAVLAPLRPLDEPAIVLPAPRTQLRGVVIRVRDDRVAITGRVVDEGGAPVAGIAVRATTVPHADGWPAITDATGAFEVRDLSPGRYWLRAVAPGGVAVQGPVEAGATDLRLVVGRYGGIAGTLDGLPGAIVRVRGPQEGFEVTRVVSATGDRFELRGLAAGTYELHATATEGAGTALVTVAPGRVAELVVLPYVPAGDRPLPPPPPPP